jgi:putative transposase
MLARVSGYPRVAFNDARRTREQARAAGVRISDTSVQPRVVTIVKTRPDRVCLGEVASVAPVQACQDPCLVYRSVFDSAAGNRKGRAVGGPLFRSRKDNLASIRLTSNGFRVTSRGVRVAKVGQVRLQCSREVPGSRPASPSSGRGDGRSYASFVVQVAETPLPATTSEVGIDLGLDRLATMSTGEVIDNLPFPRAAAHAPARARRAPSRTHRGAASGAGGIAVADGREDVMCYFTTRTLAPFAIHSVVAGIGCLLWFGITG